MYDHGSKPCHALALSGNAKIAPTLTLATFTARVLTQQFTIARYYFVISAHFLISVYFLTT